MNGKNILLEKLNSLVKKPKKEIKNKVLEDLANQASRIITFNQQETERVIELLETGSSAFDMFGWQKELVAQYYFFATTVGFIDGILDDIKREKKFIGSFNNAEEQLEALTAESLNLLKKRQEIVKDYKEVSSVRELDLVIKAMETYPSYHTFSSFYEDLQENAYQLNLQNQFIIAYNNGYIVSMKMSPESFLEEYDKLYLSISENKKQSDQKKAIVKAKKFKKE